MNALLLSAHDYRTPRKANMHFIAAELAKRGTTRFLSLRYSGLSKYKQDARTFLDDRANTVQTQDGVDCFLWKTLVHPFNTRRSALRPAEDVMFRWSAAHPPATMVDWMRDADIIFFESGTAIIHFELAERLNPSARKVYIASDDLDVIGVSAFVRHTFERVAGRLDAVCLPSRRLADNMPRTANLRFVPHGIDPGIAARAGPNPYVGTANAVSVGSMLFDRSVLEVAASAFPDMTFHVIGPGAVNRTGWPPNLRLYDEMQHDETLRYIKHARLGIAPYDAGRTPPYLADTSMKLMQYRFFGIPALCPQSATGGAADRFGYVAGSPDSIVSAMGRALAARATPQAAMLDWSEVTDRLIDPARFPDTAMADGFVA